MILVGLGANLPAPGYDDPRATCEAALGAIAAAGVRIVRRSRWYRSAPVPPSDQPWFVNGVVAVATELAPTPLLRRLHAIEAQFGRVRGTPNMARTLDLDLLAFGARVQRDGVQPHLPHPRIHERAFVLRPLAEIAPSWRHPGSGLTVIEMIARLAPGQLVEAIADEPAAGTTPPPGGLSGWQGARRLIYN